MFTMFWSSPAIQRIGQMYS